MFLPDERTATEPFGATNNYESAPRFRDLVLEGWLFPSRLLEELPRDFLIIEKALDWIPLLLV